eukprot:1733422-Rhodomonas_salina.2
MHPTCILSCLDCWSLSKKLRPCCWGQHEAERFFRKIEEIEIRFPPGEDTLPRDPGDTEGKQLLDKLVNHLYDVRETEEAATVELHGHTFCAPPCNLTTGAPDCKLFQLAEQRGE